MSKITDVTKAKYQWTELAIFVVSLAVIVAGYLNYTTYRQHQIATAAESRSDCSWNPELPVTRPVPTGPNLYVNPSLEEHILTTEPQNWASESWGDNTHTFSYLQNEGHTGQSSVKVEMGAIANGDAKWEFNSLIPATADQFYVFENYSKSNTETSMVAEIGLPDNNWLYIDLGLVAPSEDWQLNRFGFITPPQTQSVDVFQLLSSPGYLTTDDYYLGLYDPKTLTEGVVSFTFDDGAAEIYQYALPLLEKYNIKSTQYLVTRPIFQDYNAYYINRQQLKAFIDANQEIGSHTASHKHLADSSSTEIHDELMTAQEDFYRLLGHTTSTLATPYGEYDARVIAQSKKYYCGHRSTDSGYNSPDNFDLYNIRVQNVYIDTPVEDIYGWISFAQEHKVWLVLVFHEIGYGQGHYNYTPEDLDKVLNFTQHTQIKTATMSEGILMMQKSQIRQHLVQPKTP